MTPLDYEYLRKLLKDRSGLMLSADKQYLVESRLTPVTRKHGLTSLGELVAKIKAGNEDLTVDVVEAMTTNESFFFRDKIPFEHFRDAIMPHLMTARARERRIRIWCAAASTGQEPYSLAMMVKEMKDKLGGWRVEILGTDISVDVLEKAKAGVYSQFEVQRGLPIQMLVKYFTQAGDTWQIAPDIRAMVQYRQHNLLAEFAGFGRFDVVFCRNVLIYFDQADEEQRAQPHRKAARSGQLSGAWGGGDGRGPERCVQADPREARALRAEQGSAAGKPRRDADPIARGRGGALSSTSRSSGWAERAPARRGDRARAHPTGPPSSRRG